MRIALIQMSVTNDKDLNLANAKGKISEAKRRGADVAILSEMFCCPYTNRCFVEFAEPRGEKIWRCLSGAASENSLTLIGGSMPELCGGNLYNTSYVFDGAGNEIARHRKMHLFDIDIKGGQYFKESDTFSAGNEATVFDCGRGALASCCALTFASPSCRA